MHIIFKLKTMKYYISILLSLIILILIVLLFFIYKERHNYTPGSLQLEQVINKVFEENNIKNEDVIEKYHKTRRKGLYKWVEISKEINIPAGVSIKRLKAGLTGFSSVLSLWSKIIVVNDNSFLVTIGKEDKVFESLLFNLPKRIKIAIVIDDLGYENKNIYKFLSLNIPITFAILPGERYSMENVRLLEAKKMPYLLHLPLESRGHPYMAEYKEPILVKMNKKEVKDIFLKDVASVGNPVGVNNHMGSVYTEQYNSMKVLLKLIKGKNLFFLDSMTSPKSVGKKVAKDIGLKCLVNNMFLDIEDSEVSINMEAYHLMNIAKKDGSAIAIAHINKNTLYRLCKKLYLKCRTRVLSLSIYQNC